MRSPAGAVLFGALRVRGTSFAYPVVDGVARLTPELAHRYADWLRPLGLEPPALPSGDGLFQPEETVDSFGFQWAWNSAMRSDADLRWRVADRFGVAPNSFAGRLVLDAGAGAGDQTRWLCDQGAAVVSIDLSSAIEVVAKKMRTRAGWVGIQGDITALPFQNDLFDVVYCEGVIQHTRDSALTVVELCRALRGGGLILATHYGIPATWRGRARLRLTDGLRSCLCVWDRYKLLWLTGTLAVLAYVPLLGHLLRWTVVPYYRLMSDFKTTWTNTFDAYGTHAFQRRITPEEFKNYFERTGAMTVARQEETLVVARKAV